MIHAIGAANQPYDTPVAPERQNPASEKGASEELTTVTTHCNKNHKHTPACPHTTSTRPAGGINGKGKYIDVSA